MVAATSCHWSSNYSHLQIIGMRLLALGSITTQGCLLIRKSQKSPPAEWVPNNHSQGWVTFLTYASYPIFLVRITTFFMKRINSPKVITMTMLEKWILMEGIERFMFVMLYARELWNALCLLANLLDQKQQRNALFIHQPSWFRLATVLSMWYTFIQMTAQRMNDGLQESQRTGSSIPQQATSTIILYQNQARFQPLCMTQLNRLSNATQALLPASWT